MGGGARGGEGRGEENLPTNPTGQDRTMDMDIVVFTEFGSELDLPLAVRFSGRELRSRARRARDPDGTPTVAYHFAKINYHNQGLDDLPRPGRDARRAIATQRKLGAR